MHCRKKSLLTALTLGFTAASLHAAPMSLAKFEFTGAPTTIGTVTTASTAETVAPGFGSANFSVVRQIDDSNSQNAIANLTSATGDIGPSDPDLGLAQISGRQTSTYGWEDDSTSNYFEFTVNFGSINASLIEFDQLVLNGRTGVEWSNTGAFQTYNSGRRSTMTVRSDLDGFAANIGGDMMFSNTNNDFVTANIDLTGLTLLGTEESVTFRIYTRSDTNTSTGNNLFNRTQLNSVELTGVAIPEPGTLALVGIALGSLLLFRRRK